MLPGAGAGGESLAAVASEAKRSQQAFVQHFLENRQQAAAAAAAGSSTSGAAGPAPSPAAPAAATAPPARAATATTTATASLAAREISELQSRVSALEWENEKFRENLVQVPPHFICPISKNLLMDPVMAADGECTQPRPDHDRRHLSAHICFCFQVTRTSAPSSPSGWPPATRRP